MTWNAICCGGDEEDDVDDDAFVDPAELKLDFNFE